MEKSWVEIDGVRQGMFLSGLDDGPGGSVRSDKPVLLFVHGGPGMPEYFLDRTHPTGLEHDFIVCWWEQRGAGLSYDRRMPRASLTVDRLVDDTVAVARRLSERFRREKVYLLAHSWGSFIGIQAAARAPEAFHAYVGMGQVSHQQRAEVLAYEHELEEYRRRGDARMVRALEAAPVTMDAPPPKAYMRLRDKAMHRIGIGTTRDMRSVVTGVFVPVWRTPDYTLRERAAIWRGKAWSRGVLWEEFLATDLSGRVTELELPAYFCQGAFDYTTNPGLARAYYDLLRAPVKGFYTFANSAHSPAFEEPERFREVLREDVLTGSARLADAVSRSRPPVSPSGLEP
jgi:pimeloyl-ACP methyl ester carboxylesterase